MGEVLAGLEHVLRSNDKEKITLDEELVLQRCKARAVNTFLLSAGVSSALVWGATKQRFNMLARTSFSIGAALVLGGWTFDRSLNSSVRRILAAHGTRMQKELAKIVMTRSLQDPASAVSKIFYAEHVYDDTTQDKPLIRWRARNLYEDDVIVADSIKDSPSSKNLPPSGSQPKEHAWNTSGDTIVGLGELISDPLDCILGYPEAGGENPQNAGVVSRRELRAQRRRRWRHRMRHEKSYSDHSSSETLTV